MNARRSNDSDDTGARDRRSLCQYEMDHPRIDERLEQLETRTDKHDSAFAGVVGELKLFREEFITHRTKMVTLLAVAASAGSATGVVLGLIVAILALR